MERKDSMEEKKSFFSIVAYGIHSNIQKRLKKEIEKEFKVKSNFIYEYFLIHPIIKKRETIGKNVGFLPYLLRILHESKFVPKIENTMPRTCQEIELLPHNLKNLMFFWNFFSPGASLDLTHAPIAKELFKCWFNEKKFEEEDSWVEYDKEYNMAKGNFRYKIEFLKEGFLNMINKWDKETKTGALKEYMITVLPWLSWADAEYLNIGAFSISSRNIFYGQFLVFHPNIDDLKYPDGIFRSAAIEKLIKRLQEVYVPVLLFFENLWEEKELEQKLSTKPDWDKYIFLSESLEYSNDQFERAMHELWKGRKELYETYSPKDEAIKKIKESIHFPNYVISSLAMVSELRKIVTPRNQRQKDSYLPCFLVIGRPGSGKDTIAKIIQLFFPEYRFGKRYTINMAQLKPNYISVPLISGGEIELVRTISPGETSDGSPVIEIQIKGLLKKIWERQKKEHPDLEKARNQGMMPVVILDELNSLDIDAQGALLRVLENARLQPLGKPEEEGERIDFLVIGTANEPEEVLTLEEPLRHFLMEKPIFGGALGKTLYEYFRNLRRLREDLFYRLIREGKICTLDLNKRREDIPILFSLFVKQALPNEIKWDNLWFDFDIFEALMSEIYSWSGNFRELQSAAKKTANRALLNSDNREVLKKVKEGEKTNKFFIISIEHIDEVLKELQGIKDRIRDNDSTTSS